MKNVDMSIDAPRGKLLQRQSTRCPLQLYFHRQRASADWRAVNRDTGVHLDAEVMIYQYFVLVVVAW